MINVENVEKTKEKRKNCLKLLHWNYIGIKMWVV